MINIYHALEKLLEHDIIRVFDFIVLIFTCGGISVTGIVKSLGLKRAAIIVPLGLAVAYYFWRDRVAEIFAQPVQAHQEAARPPDSAATSAPQAVLPSQDKCANISAFNRAKESGYNTLVMFFKMCPFVSEETVDIAGKGAEAFNEMSTDFRKYKNYELAVESAARGMSIGTALMSYTFLHGGVRLGRRSVPGQKEIVVTIEDWPEPRAHWKFR
jgi:hypothetical protein